MENYVLETFLAVAGFFLIFIFLSEDFLKWCQRLRAHFRPRPQLRMLAYPALALLFMGAAALIIRVLLRFASLRFAYE